jgi:lysophospholipase L1-like esterase
MTQKLPSRSKTILLNILSLVVALTVSLAAAEGVLRLKNSSMRNYDIEMWRYARELKFQSPDPRLGHEHVANSHALLQSVDIRTNSWGLRGGAVSETPALGVRRILMLGSSIALGWGVEEDKVVSSVLQQKFAASGQNVEVLNGGIGNYNAQRYVDRFLTQLAPLQPTDLLVLAFVRDGEELDPDGGNFVLRNSELAVTTWIAFHRLFDKSGEASLIDHYRDVYKPGSPGLEAIRTAFARLATYAQQHRIRITMAMVPDIHNLTNYPLGFVHDIFAQIARDNGFAYVDLLQTFQGMDAREIWAMPGDPHPNAKGHALMADAIFPTLAQE